MLHINNVKDVNIIEIKKIFLNFGNNQLEFNIKWLFFAVRTNDVAVDPDQK